MGLCVSSNVYLLYLLYLSPYSPLFTFIQQTLPLFTQGNVRGRRHRILFRNRDSQRSRLCLALPACFCVRSRSHAQSVNRNLVFHLIFVVRSQTCSESFVYYNFELCDIRSAEPMHASRKSNHASVLGLFCFCGSQNVRQWSFLITSDTHSSDGVRGGRSASTSAFTLMYI